MKFIAKKTPPICWFLILKNILYLAFKGLFNLYCNTCAIHCRFELNKHFLLLLRDEIKGMKKQTKHSCPYGQPTEVNDIIRFLLST